MQCRTTVESRSSVQQSEIPCRKKWLRCKYTDVGCARSTVLHGDSNPLLLGMDPKAWRSLEITDWNSSNGTPVPCRFPCRSHDLRVVKRASLFLFSSHTVLFYPSNVNPRMSLVMAHMPSSLSNFFYDNGSFSSTSSAGKTS